MSLIVGSAVTGAGGGAYTISNSLRFRQSASAYLSRTPASTSNQTTWTWSGWIKRGQITASVGYQNVLFAAQASTPAKDNWTKISFLYDDTMRIGARTGGTDYLALVTTQVFRDPSAWYHIVVAIDTTQATSSNRAKLYINGSQVTAFSTATYPSQNYTMPYVNAASSNLFIGRYLDNSYEYLDGYQTEINFIDGQALTPSSFGATNASTGVWQPTAYTGTYGTNGFYLKFSDIATTSGSNAGLGKDFSGNGNYWNTTNISVTAGSTYDAMTDSPTPASATVGNFCTLNPLDKYANDSLSNANLTWTGSTVATSANRTTFGLSSGKWYCEYTVGTGGNTTVGIVTAAANPGNYIGSGTGDGYGYWGYTTSYKIANGGTTSAYGGGAWSAGDIIGIYFDADAGSIGFTRNGTDYGNAYTGIAANTWFFAVGHNGASGNTGSFNFGQRAFTYTAPSGYKAVNTYNLPTPTIGASSTTLANKYFDALLYTGANPNAIQSVTGLAFQPDFVWIKSRITGYGHAQFDALRGANSRLQSNTTAAAASSATYMTSFNSGGFTLGVDYGQNAPSEPYVSWNWKGNNSSVSNTNGSITSTVSANTTSGFSVVTYTGTGANATVGHGLGAVPKMIIVKATNSAGWLWAVYHVSVGNTGYLRLSATDTTTTDSTWQNTTPTSSVFSIGTQGHVNYNSSTSYVAYCFAEVAGFSKFGSYTGNGSTDGPFIYTGFRPKFILIKASTTAQSWQIYDTARSPNNLNSLVLFPNLSNAEQNQSSVASLDALSNGFKLRVSDAGSNGAYTYIYMAFAESPFNYSLAR